MSGAHTPKVFCSGCEEAVYEFPAGPFVIRNHDIEILTGGRYRWISRDLQAVIHECSDDYDYELTVEDAVGPHAASPRVLQH